jgi:hypothetical protein
VGVGTGSRRCRNGQRVVAAVEVGVPLTSRDYIRLLIITLDSLC